MMDLLFVDSEEIPVPIEDVRICELIATLNKDGRRVKINLTLTPFQQSPSCELWIKPANGNRISSATIIQAIDHSIEITMHLNAIPTQDDLQVYAHLYYTKALDEAVEEQQEYEKPEAITLDKRTAQLII